MALLIDRAVTDLATYAPEQLGRTQFKTPEGFLLCEGVRIARTGPMIYAAAEMPDIEPGPHHAMITVLRDAEVLFHPDTIQSFAGKPVTNGHPPEPVTPDNARKYSVGVVLNPRRGEGVETDYLIADLLITDAEAIGEIDAKRRREVSAGYDVDVEQIKPGVARQTMNLGNHVALVERARGGPALAIQDAAEEPEMATRTTRKILDGIRKAFRAKDEAALEQQLEQAEGLLEDDGEGGEPQRIVIEVAAAPAAAAPVAEVEDEEADPTEARFKTIEDSIVKMSDALEKLINPPAADAEPEEKDLPEKVVDDEAAEEEKDVDKGQAQDAMSKAEILAPGVRLAAFDSAAAKVKRATVTAMRRTALKAAFADSARKVHVDAILGGRVVNFDKMAPSQVAMVFDAAAAVAKAANNTTTNIRPFDIPQGPMTPAKLQARIEERRKAARG